MNEAPPSTLRSVIKRPWIDHNTNSFLIYVLQDLACLLQALPVDQSRAKVIKPLSTAGSVDQGVNAEFTHSHCTLKPDLCGFERDFWLVEKRYIILFIMLNFKCFKLKFWHITRFNKQSQDNICFFFVCFVSPIKLLTCHLCPFGSHTLYTYVHIKIPTYYMKGNFFTFHDAWWLRISITTMFRLTGGNREKTGEKPHRFLSSLTPLVVPQCWHAV